MSAISGVGGAGGGMPARWVPPAGPAAGQGVAAATGGKAASTAGPLGTASTAGALAAGNLQQGGGALETAPTKGLALSGTAATVSTYAGQAMASLSQLSISQSSESLMVSQQPMAAASNNELLGAVLLMLLVEYMQSNDDKEKEGLLALMGLLLQSQQQSNAQQSMLLYSSSSLSIESTQMQYMSGESASSAYTNAGVSPSAGGDGSSGLNVVA